MSQTDILGKLVLSSNFGIGRIVDINIMGDKEFLVIESEQNSVKNFVPRSDEESYRFLSEEATMDSIINDLKTKNDIREFESKKDRINFYRDQSNVQDITVISGLLCELNHLEDRSSTEEKIFSKLIDTIALEYSYVYKEEIEKSTDIITGILQEAKGE